MTTQYTFYERDDDAKTRLLGDVTIDDFGQVMFSDKDVKELIFNTSSLLIKGHFNPDNPAHWMALPEIYNGSRLWVVADVIAAKAQFRLKNASN